jgi:hypothetical protein
MSDRRLLYDVTVNCSSHDEDDDDDHDHDTARANDINLGEIISLN